MSIRLGELFISLGLSTASFSKNLDAAKKQVLGSSREMERTFGVIGKAVAGMAISTATGLAFLTRQAINNAEQMGALAQKAGLSVEALSGLTHAAEQSEVSQEQLVVGLTKLSKTMEAAARGSTVLGVSFRDQQGNLRLTEGVLLDLAEQFQMMPDGARKTALAMQVFGKSGADMIPFLNQGRGGIEKLLAEAERLGLAISTKMARQADQFNDALSNVGKMARGVANGIAVELLPTLNQLMESFAGLSREKGLGMQQIGQGIVRGVKFARDPLEQFSLLWAAVKVQVFKTKGAVEELEQVMLRVLTGWKAPKNLEELFGGPPGKGIAQRLDQWLPPGRRPGGDGDDEAKRIQKTIDALRLQVVELQLSPAAFAAYKAGLEGASASQQTLIASLTTTIEQLKAAQGAFIGPQSPLDFLNENLSSATISTKEFDEAFEEQKSRMAEGRRVWESVLDPIGKYSLELQKLTVLLNAGAIDTTTFKMASDNLAESLGLMANAMPAIDESLRRMQESMRRFAESSLQALGDALIFGGGFRQVLQGIIQDLGRLLFQMLVIQPIIKSIFGGGGGGGFNFSGLLAGFGGFGGWFQHGGSVSPGKPIVVGERGRELFVPPVRGDIIPNHALSAGAVAGNQVIQIDARGADHGTVIKIASLMSRAHSQELLRRMRDAQDRTA